MRFRVEELDLEDEPKGINVSKYKTISSGPVEIPSKRAGKRKCGTTSGRTTRTRGRENNQILARDGFELADDIESLLDAGSIDEDLHAPARRVKPITAALLRNEKQSDILAFIKRLVSITPT